MFPSTSPIWWGLNPTLPLLGTAWWLKPLLCHYPPSCNFVLSLLEHWLAWSHVGFMPPGSHCGTYQLFSGILLLKSQVVRSPGLHPLSPDPVRLFLSILLSSTSQWNSKLPQEDTWVNAEHTLLGSGTTALQAFARQIVLQCFQTVTLCILSSFTFY